MNDSEIGRTPIRAAEENASVRCCCEAADRTYRTLLAKGENRQDCWRAAERAYQNAMPPLAGENNISDFVACVIHGLLIGVFLESRASKLLYGAQVAGAMLRKQPAPRPAP